jgi:hypothetical protein
MLLERSYYMAKRVRCSAKDHAMGAEDWFWGHGETNPASFSYTGYLWLTRSNTLCVVPPCVTKRPAHMHVRPMFGDFLPQAHSPSSQHAYTPVDAFNQNHFVAE